MNLTAGKVFAGGQWNSSANPRIPCAMSLAIRRFRKARGWTLEQLAERVDISVPYLSQLERGANEKAPGGRLLERFASVFECSVPELFEDSTLTEEMKRHLEDVHSLPPDLQKVIRDLARTLRDDFERDR